MRALGFTADLFVTDCSCFTFYEHFFERLPDLQHFDEFCEWTLAAQPEITLRVRVDAARAGNGHAAIEVTDGEVLGESIAERVGLQPRVIERNNVQIHEWLDPSGNVVRIWEDLSPSRSALQSADDVNPGRVESWP